MKKLIFCTVLLATLTIPALAAQQGQKPAEMSAAKTGFVADDDGGLTEIVPADPSTQVPRPSGAAPAMKSVQQVSIFLGSAWGDAQVRPRQSRLRDLAAAGRPAELRNHSVEVVPAAPLVEDFSDLSRTPVSDLAIQARLAEMLKTGAIPAPGANTVYVVFLAPGIQSTLGAGKAGVDYSAYHNLLHVAAGAIRYVVVPFNDNADRHSAAASQALVSTVFNPTGGPQ